MFSDGCDRGSDAGSLAPSDFTRWPAGLARFPRNDTDLVLRQQIKQASCSNRNELALLQTTCLNDMANVRAGRLLDMDMLPVYGVDLANFEPNAVGSTVWKERVIIFEIDAYAYECLSSDCTSWMLHHMTLITPSYNIKLTAKRHPSWSLKSPREAHRMSVERVYTQRFLQSTLDEYQSLILWAHKNSPSERTAHWLGLVADLRVSQIIFSPILATGLNIEQATPFFSLKTHSLVPRMHAQFSMCMFLKEFGAPEKSGYWIVEEPDVGKRLNYISRYNYRPRNPRGAPWEPVIKGFLHYIMDRSMGNQVIAHLDCNEFGVMSNLVLFDRRSGPFTLDW